MSTERFGIPISASSISGSLIPRRARSRNGPCPSSSPATRRRMLDLEEDKNGEFWLDMMFQGALAKFDPKTEKFEIYALPAELNDQVAQLDMLGLQFARRRQGMDG